MKICITVFLILFFAVTPAVANDSDNLFERANQAYKNNQVETAIIHLKNLIVQTPSHLPAHILMAEVLLDAGKPASALSELETAKTLGGDKVQLSLLFGQAYLQQNKYNAVLDLLEEDSLDEITSSKINVLRGNAQLGLRQLKLSSQSFLYALKQNETNVDAKLGLARVNLNYFNYSEAEKYVDEVLTSYFPPIEAWVLKASIQQYRLAYQAALDAINQALQLNPNHIQALIIRATLYLELVNYPAAQLDIDTILTQVNNEPRAEFLQAIIAIHTGNAETVAKQLNQVVDIIAKIPPDDLLANPSYLYLASTVFYHQKKYELANKYITDYLTIDQLNVDAMSFSAMIKIADNNYIEAKNILTKANLLDSNNAKIVSLLGLVYLELKQYEKANFYFDQAKLLAPHAAIIDTHLAKSYLATGDYTNAISKLLAIDSANIDQTTISFLLIEAYIKSGEIDQALKLAKQLLNSAPNNPDLIHHLGFVYELSQQNEAAKTQYQQALALEPLHVKSIISLAQLALKAGEVNNGIAALNAAIVKLPENIELMQALANMYLSTQQPQLALSWFEKAYKTDKGNFNILKPMVSCLLMLQQLDEAIELLNSYLFNNQKTEEAYLLLGNIYLQNKNTSKALQTFNDALKVGANRANIYFYIAKSHQLNNNLAEAITTYKKSIAWNNEFEPSIIALGQLLNKEQRATETIEMITSAPNYELLSVAVKEVLARAYYLAKQYGQAEQLFLQLKDQRPDIAISSLSLIFRETNQLDKAIRFLKQELQLKPNSLLTNISLAEIYIRQKDWQNADQIYQHLLSINNTQPVILNNAAFVALSLKDYDRAKSLVEASLAIDGNAPDALDTLGWINYLTENFDKALPLFRKALAIDYSKQDIKYHLALTLNKLGQDKEAFTTLQEVVNSKRAFAEKDTAKSLLDQWATSLKLKAKN